MYKSALFKRINYHSSKDVDYSEALTKVINALILFGSNQRVTITISCSLSITIKLPPKPAA